MANGAGGSITSFFTIWTSPRATIRRIVDTDPTRNAVALAAFGSGISALSGQWSKALGNNANLSVLWPLWVAVIVAFSAALGVFSLFMGGVVLKWSGSLLGGVASRVEVRAAIAWSQVPAIAGAILFLIAVLLGVPIPVPTPGALPQIDPAFYMIMVVEGVLGFWGFIVSLKCIGEVHRFSPWRALIAVLIPGLIVIIVLVLGSLLFHAIVGGHH
jgi:hypothetical protein